MAGSRGWAPGTLRLSPGPLQPFRLLCLPGEFPALAGASGKDICGREEGGRAAGGGAGVRQEEACNSHGEPPPNNEVTAMLHPGPAAGARALPG